MVLGWGWGLVKDWVKQGQEKHQGLGLVKQQGWW
jgi:hypothetical protein